MIRGSEIANSTATNLKVSALPMDRNIDQLLLKEIEDIDKDPDTHRADKEIEALVRSHGRSILPYIPNIMDTIIKTLSSNSCSVSVHQTCSRVVPSIARYGIDPLMPENEKARIISFLCKPLSDALMGSQESTTSGAALCLRALVESDNWRFASDDVVNEVCLKVTGALEEIQTQTVSHMSLVMALLKHNSFIVDAYARSLLRSGVQILTDGFKENNSQKRLSATQMINILMKSVDSRSISSEVASVVDVMKICQNDQLSFVRDAAFEALQTATTVAGLSGSPNMGSNFDEMDRNNAEIFESDNGAMYLFEKDDPIGENRLSIGQSSCNLQCGRHAARRLWDNEMRTFDIMSKDGQSGTSSDSPEVQFGGSTSRKLARSLHNSSNANFEDNERQNSRAMASPASDEVEWNPLMTLNVVKDSPNLDMRTMRRRNSQHSVWDDYELLRGSELPSTVGICSGVCIKKNRDQMVNTNKNRYGKAAPIFCFPLFMILLAVILSVYWKNDDEVCSYIVPT